MLPIPHIDLPHLDEYLNTLNAPTATVYRRALERVRVFLSHQGVPIESLRLSHLQLYRMHLKASFSSLTCNKELSAVKAYLKFLCIHCVIERNAGEGLTLFSSEDYTPTNALEPEEVQRVLESVDVSTPMGLLHSAVLHTMLYTGIRCAELTGIRACDLNAENGIPTITVLGKGQKRRTLPLAPPAFSAIKLYLDSLYAQKYTREANAPLFQSSTHETGKPLHSNTVQFIVRKYVKLAGITKRISPHSLRATCVSNALENGASVVQVQYMGGWNSMDMVLRYDRHRQMLKNSAVFAVDYSKTRSQK